MKTLVLSILVSSALMSCSSTRLMSLSVLEPAAVTLSPDIKKAGVINRSVPAEKGKVLDVVEKIVTLEGARLDKEGAEASISSLTHELALNKRFSDVKKIVYEGQGNNSPGMYPAALSWETVGEICEKNDVDILFSLEMFDTDSKINYAAYPVKINTPVGNVPAMHQEASMRTWVKTGWRIYDPKARFILDEATLERFIVFRGRGINPMVAANALIGRKEAVIQVGNRAGTAYANRVNPFWLRVSRHYFTRANRSFKVARRKAESGNWNGAAEIWLEQSSSAKRKVAGRACYNMAIISEIDGDLAKSIEWAQRAYEDHNIKLALRYIRVLENRRFRNNILEDQQMADAGQ